MRLQAARTVLSLVAVVSAVSLASAETTRTLRAELSADAVGHFAVENLAGTMRVVPATGRTVVAVATVHAESDALAGSMKLEQVVGKQGVPTLRVIYPLDEEKTLRYPGRGKEERFLEKMFGGSSTTTEYDGHKVKVSETSGVLLYADLEVQVPGHLDNAVFRNLVGNLEGKDVEGKILFDTSSGDVTLASVKGEIKSDTGSGDVKLTGATGSFTCDTGSGDCDLSEFSGDVLRCDVGSGDVTIRKATAHRLDIDTGSGDVHVTEGDVEEFLADTGSGDVRLENPGTRLVHVKADAGSGNVVLRLAPDATFEALADQGSGDITMRYKDAQPIVRHKEVIGYRRGDARTKIDVDTGSGDLTIEPGA
jgi:putative adhesin